MLNLGSESWSRASSARSKVGEQAGSVLAAFGLDGDSVGEEKPAKNSLGSVAKSVFFEKGDLCKCPCGWCPDTEDKNLAQTLEKVSRL